MCCVGPTLLRYCVIKAMSKIMAWIDLTPYFPIALNRIVGGGDLQIHGQINANGTNCIG